MLQDKTVVLDVRFHRPGIQRRGSIDAVETEADKTFLGLRKLIVKSPEYAEVGCVQSHCREYLVTRALPSPFREGTYLVPVTLVEEVYAKLETFRARHQKKVDGFLAAYPAQKDVARDRLADQYREADYPVIDEMADRFGMEWHLLKFSLPGADDVGEVIAACEKSKAMNEWDRAADECRLALREGFAELIGRVARGLETRPDGKKRRLAKSTYGKLVDFLEVFQRRNVMDDDELHAMVKDARKVLDGVTPNGLGRDASLRGTIKGELDRIGTAAARSVVALDNRRAITFGDE